MTKPPDDFEAVRRVIEALEPFDDKDRERIVRWAAEKLGMAVAASSSGKSPVGLPSQPTSAVSPSPAVAASPKDIRSFVLQKIPRSDAQMAAVVAYYYHFEAPPAERKDSIGKEELIDACRKAERIRPARPEQVLVNTYHAGLFDRAGTAGQYKLNSVGENLVAMVLPEQGSSSVSTPRNSAGNKGKSKKTVRPKSKPKSR